MLKNDYFSKMPFVIAFFEHKKAQKSDKKQPIFENPQLNRPFFSPKKSQKIAKNQEKIADFKGHFRKIAIF